jgi:predicted DNA-binding antitoxin AbrB/MazE fold protein
MITVPAKYETGVFRPLEDVALREGTVVEIILPAEAQAASKRRPIKDLPFYELWADRDDITDGVSYVDALRDNPRG